MSAKKLFAILAALLLITAACGDDDDDDASSTTTSVSGGADTPQLTYDGTTCTYAGPSEVTAGVVVVELTNTSDDNANIGVLEIEEGYTVDDVAEYVNDPAKTAGGGPDWLSDMGTGGALRAKPGETLTWEESLDAGEYVLICNQSVSGSPWAAGVVTVGSGLTVVEG